MALAWAWSMEHWDSSACDTGGVWPVWQSYKKVIQTSEYEEQSTAVSKWQGEVRSRVRHRAWSTTENRGP